MKNLSEDLVVSTRGLLLLLGNDSKPTTIVIGVGTEKVTRGLSGKYYCDLKTDSFFLVAALGFHQN